MSWAEQNRLLAMSKNGRRASLFLLCKGDDIASQFILESSSVVSLSSTVSLRTLLVFIIGEVLHAWLCTLIPFMLVVRVKDLFCLELFLIRNLPEIRIGCTQCVRACQYNLLSIYHISTHDTLFAHMIW